jgi:hypothetical protein
MNKSESISSISKALVSFNTEITKITKDAKNPFFKNKYATLDNIVDDIRPILAKNGLCIMQMPSGSGDAVIMKTLLLHESGEYIESDILTMKPAKNDPQAIGSCITYARRYSIGAFLSLNTGEDDDGNKASFKNANLQQIGTIKVKWMELGHAHNTIQAQTQKLYGCGLESLTEAQADEFIKKLSKQKENKND